MIPSAAIVNFIKLYETLHDGDRSQIGLQPKPDAGGIWTEGYGHAMRDHAGNFLRVAKYPTIASVLPFSKIKNEQQALELLYLDLEAFSKGVSKRLKLPVTQNQFDALVSHSFNCGFSETLYRLVNSNAKDADIKKFMTKTYITAGGVFMLGLQYRRNDEWEIWKGINYLREYKLTA